jgi:dihydroorotate dehydrogenase
MEFWPFVKPILFQLDPERAHHLALARLESLQWSAWGRALLRGVAGAISEQSCDVMGLPFRHPLGLAAGFDKDARAVIGLQELGFSHVEIGTVTPRPQPGNPKPRIWRFPEANALVNALGFPGEGMQIVAKRLQTIRSSGLLKIPVGINIGKNADTPLEKAGSDYRAVLEELYEVGDYFAVNVSSPNTIGLRSLQTVANLRVVLEPLQNILARRGVKPLLIKIAPDLADEELILIARLANELQLAGIIAGNTTIRRELVRRAVALERGGLSGAPQFTRTIEMVKLFRTELKDSICIIAVGGIANRQGLDAAMAAGANLVQAYTGFVYGGPSFVSGCARR